MPYPPTVETARLTLRRLRHGDEDAFLATWADPDVWHGIRPGTPFDPEHGRQRFRHHLQHREKHGFGLWLINEQATEDNRWGGDHVRPFQANVPVVLDRVGVIPGQYVYADSSGAVVIPEDQLEEVLAGAREISADDERFRADIAREERGARS